MQDPDHLTGAVAATWQDSRHPSPREGTTVWPAGAWESCCPVAGVSRAAGSSPHSRLVTRPPWAQPPQSRDSTRNSAPASERPRPGLGQREASRQLPSHSCTAPAATGAWRGAPRLGVAQSLEAAEGCLCPDPPQARGLTDTPRPPGLRTASLTAQGHQVVCPATLPTVSPSDPTAPKHACLAEPAPHPHPSPRALGPATGTCRRGPCHWASRQGFSVVKSPFLQGL